MPTKKSNPGKRSTPKKKASAKSNAAERIATRPGAQPEDVRVPPSEKERSMGKFVNETPLSGETGRSPRSGISGRSTGRADRLGREPGRVGQTHGRR